MEKEEQSLEAEETTPLVRNSRNGGDVKILAEIGGEVNGGVSDGVSMRKSYTIQSQNGSESENEELLKREESNGVLENELEAINIEEKIEDSDSETERVLGNGAEAINGEKNSKENLVFHDKLEGLGVSPISTVWKTQIVEEPSSTKYDISSLDPAIQSKGGSIRYNQHEEEVEENGVSSSTVQPPDDSSQEGVDSTSAYTIRETILKGPAKYNFSSLDLPFQSKGGSIRYNRHKEEVEGNGVSSSNIEPPDSSSQEGVNSTSTYTIRETILKGPAKYNFSSLDLAFQSKGGSIRYNQHEEEVEENGVSSSNMEPSDNSSQEGVNSTPTYTISDTILKGPVRYNFSSLDPAIEFNGASVISNQYEGEFEKNSISSSNVQPSGSSSQEGRTSYEPSKEIESAETEVINEDDLEITELEVERVIQKQTTHDLFCPNCKSCITKRVILSKRKRRVRTSDEVDKRPKTGTAAVGTVPPDDQVHQGGEIGNEDAQTPAIDEDEPYRGPAIFRCLSCFSIFIPTGNGFRFFQSAGGKNGEENVRDEQAPEIKKNWLSNIFFKPNRQKTPVEEGSSPEANVQQVSSSIPSSDPPRESGQPLVSQDTGSPARAAEPLKGTAAKTAAHKGRDLTLPDLDNLKLPLLVDDTKSEVLAVDQQMEPKPNLEVHTSRDTDVIQLPTSSSGWTVGDVDDTLTISVPIPHGEKDVRATIVTTNTVDSGNADSRSSANGDVYPAKGPQQRTTTTTLDFSQDKPTRAEMISEIGDAPAAQGNETRITIDTHPQPLPHIDEGVIPLTVPLPQSGTQTSTADREVLGVREERKVEVIKSIVYGGLAETMTSLSVVSSAAGGGAATLNVLTLGAANLIGGLFIIAHNLWDLRCDRVEEQLSNQVTEQADRYRQLLGRRQNFALHAVVAVMSYIMFGLVPPVVYGFSFRESDDKQLKLLMVAAASLVCILVLTVGKVYVQRPQKSYFKTVMTFLVLGVSVSGVSYAAGGLVERLLEKLGLFEPSSAAPNLVGPVGSGWASY